eukprot:6321245-Alexandrium_andersonii.AAC.1
MFRFAVSCIHEVRDASVLAERTRASAHATCALANFCASVHLQNAVPAHLAPWTLVMHTALAQRRIR